MSAALPDPAPHDFDIVGLLGLQQPKRRGDEIFISPCPYCGKESKSGTCSWNPKSGFFNCLSCGTKGGWQKLRKDFGRPSSGGGGSMFSIPRELIRKRVDPIEEEVRAPEPSEPKVRPQHVVQERAVVKDDPSSVDAGLQDKALAAVRAMQEKLWSEGGTAVRQYLVGRGISEESLIRFGVGVTRSGEEMMFPFWDAKGRYRRSKARSIVDKSQMRYLGSSTDTAKDPEAGIPLWGVHLLDATLKYAVIVEGEIDALTLDTVGVPNVVALPGANMWKSWHARAFAPFDRVFIATDNDAEGEKAAVSIMADIGLDRAVRVVFGKNKDANDALHKEGWSTQQMLDAIFDSHPGGIQSGSIMRTLKEHALERMEPIPYGWKSLDRYLGGGMRRGEMTVVTGITGHGKSQFTLDLALSLADREIPVLYCSLEIDDAGLFVSFVCKQAGRSWGDLKGDLPSMDDAVERLAGLPVYYIRRDPQRNTVRSILEAIRYAKRSLGIAVVVVDPLQFLVRPRPGTDVFEEMAVASLGFSQLAKDLGVHVLLVAHQNVSGSKKRASMYGIKYGTTLPQDADNVLVVHKRDATADGRKSAEFEVAKARAINALAGKSAVFVLSGERWVEDSDHHEKRPSTAKVAEAGDAGLDPDHLAGVDPDLPPDDSLPL